MASVVYNAFKAQQLGGRGAGTDETPIDLTTDTIKIALVTSSYTPDIDTHDYFDDVTNEVSGTGYTTGGETLTVTSSVDTTNDKGKFDATDVTWSSSTITARGAVIYKDTGTAATSPLICYLDFTEDKSSTSGDFTITFNAEGIINLT